MSEHAETIAMLEVKQESSGDKTSDLIAWLKEYTIRPPSLI